MKNREQKISQRKLRSSYFSTIVSVALVLFALSLVGLLVLNANKLSKHVKENIGFTVIIHDNVKEVEMIRLQKDLDASKYVKSTRKVTKQQAAQELINDLGEDFVELLGYNPLLPSIEVRLFAEYANPDSILVIEDNLLTYPQVKEVAYQKSLIEIVNKNIRKMSLALLVFSGLLFLISMTLINNTIRLSVYSKRFIIKTMQLVGATKSFVRTPFVLKSLSHTLISVVITYILLGGVIYWIDREFPELAVLNDIDTLAILFFGIFIIGMSIIYASTWFAVNRYLRMRSNDLYY